MIIKYLIRISILTLFLTSPCTHADTQSSYAFTATTDEQRFTTLTKEIRCVVCQNQSIADSYAPIASDLRNKIYRMVLEQKSDAEIKDYLVKRYGEFILLQPRFNLTTALLWIFPFAALAVIVLFVLRI